MPQFFLLDVILATLLQRYELFLNCASFFAIIFVSRAILLLRGGSYYTYNLFTLDIYISKFQNYRYRELLYIIIYNNLII